MLHVETQTTLHIVCTTLLEMTRVSCILLLLFCGASAAEVENDSVSLVQKRTEVLALEDASADDDDLDADDSDEDDVADLDEDKDVSDDDDLEVDCIGGWVPGDSWSRDTPAEPRYTASKEECVWKL